MQFSMFTMQEMSCDVVKPPAIFALNRGQISLPPDVIHNETYVKIYTGWWFCVHN